MRKYFLLKLLYRNLLYIPMEKMFVGSNDFISLSFGILYKFYFMTNFRFISFWKSLLFFHVHILDMGKKRTHFQYNNILCDLVVETRRIALRDNITIELIVYQPVSLNACLSIEFGSSVLLRYDGQTDGRTDRRLEIRPAAFYDHS